MSDWDIYFGGSIRGGRKDVDRYAAFVDYMEAEHGNVLTDHVANPDLGDEGQDIPDEQIDEIDEWYEGMADAGVFDVSTPSHGVGMEINGLVYDDVPVLCLYQEGSENALSGRISGNPQVVVREYTGVEEAKGYIDEFFTALDAGMIEELLPERHDTLVDPSTIQRMQEHQEKHDAEYHPATFNSPKWEKLRHYDDHYTKYAGRVARIFKGNADEKDRNLLQLFGDTTIITFCAANALNIDLAAVFEDISTDIYGEEYAEYPLDPDNLEVREDILHPFWEDLSDFSGRIAKEFDDKDHAFERNYVKGIRTATTDIFRTLVETTYKLDLNLWDVWWDRLTEVKEKRIK